MFLSIGCAYADGAYAVDTTDEVYPVEKADTIRLAQQSAVESDATK